MGTKRPRGEHVQPYEKSLDVGRDDRLRELQARIEKELPVAEAAEATEVQLKIFAAQAARRQQERLRRQIRR